MAPIVLPARSGIDNGVKSILSFAATLHEELPNAASHKTASELFKEVEKHISAFPSKSGQVASKREDLDSSGTALWNLCTRLRRDYDSSEDIPIILLMARVFAFLVLDFAHDRNKSLTSSILRLMKVGIKTAKNCLHAQRLDLTLKVLEKVSYYQSKSTKWSHDGGADAESQESLSAEYFVLRTALAWRQDEPQVAEFMFEKLVSLRKSFSPNTVENLADILYELGKDLLGKKQYGIAATWLDRAYAILNDQVLDRLSIDASELRISIIQSLVKALLALQEREASEKARGLVDALENEVGDKLVILVLRLEMISAVTNESFDSNHYSDTLRRMTRTIMLSDTNFKLMMHHIRKLHEKSPSLACKTLDDLLRLRVLQCENSEWIEKALITRMWITVSRQEDPDALASLEDILSITAANIKEPFTSGATLAAHMLLWKRIESNYTKGHYDVTEQWCRLAMHQIFEKPGEHNMARIARKLLLCALARQDIGSAGEIFGSMSEVAKNEPMTRFLMYKIAIRCEENELAADCLKVISTKSSNDSTLLYACILDAQQVGHRPQVLAALQLVLEKSDYEAPSTIHLPTLLRITIGLIHAMLNGPKSVEDSYDVEATVEKLCTLFERALVSIRKTDLSSRGTDILWTIPELDWFSKNSYNLAINHLSTWTPKHSIRLLESSIGFINSYPKDISQQVSDDLSLRKMFCEFSASTALVSMARGEEIIERQLQFYLNLRKHVESFDGQLQEKINKIEEGPAQDLLQKLAILLTFDFEAACQLKAWDSLEEVIFKAEVCKSMHIYELMADCILSSHAPTQVLVMNLKKIINGAWALESFDIIRLSKYMRCLFHVAVSDNQSVAEQLLDRVQSLAEETSGSGQPYPLEELEWVATRAFNHAIDLYCGGDDEACRNWASKALGVAHFCSDGGAMERLLQSKLLGLSWDI